MATHGFELVREQHIPELDTRAFLYRHRTGAQLLSLVNQDENKVFGISFRTPPADSTGVAHILEHAVLCGSRKFPVKEPFVELLKGSLKTFLNAFTYPDKTCYPVASQNLQDFYNLVDVYLDAVFYPRITPQVLQQEGWHYELEGLDAPLLYKGVVFNEMKGAYSSPERVLSEYVQHTLFPDTTYGVESGGHPRHIPELSFAQFKAFHETFYHPGNSRIFFCGDDDPEKRLVLLEEYLGAFAPVEVDSAVRGQPRFAAPRRVVRQYAAGQDQERQKSMVAVNWLLDESVDFQTSAALQVLGHVLTGTPAAPLHKALIDSGLGEDLVGAGMETELYQLFFSTGLKGVAPGREDEVEALVLDALGKLAAGGIDPETIAASINTLEFGLRENNTGSFPRGLALMLRALTMWLYDRDPLAPLAFEAPLAAIKRQWREEPRYFESLVQEHLLDNPHRTTLLLQPDPQLQGREEAEEKARLEAVRAGMSRADLEGVIASARELKERQEAPDPPEALATIPRLGLADLDRRIRTIPLERVEQEGVPVLYHDLSTNGIVYLDLGFDLRVLPQDLLPYVPLFGRALLEIGTRSQDFVRLSQRIGSRTGGIWPQTLVSPQRHDGRAVARLFLRGKAMRDQVGDLLDIARDVLLSVKLDNQERFLQMVLEEKAGEEAGLVPGGHGVVSLRLRSQFDEAAWVSEQMEGVSYLFFLRQLVQDVEQDWAGVLARLEQVGDLLVNRRGVLANATLAGADRPAFEKRLAAFLRALPEAPVPPAAWQPEYAARCEGLVIPAQVNYVAKAADLYDLGYRLHGSVMVISRYLRNTYLWDRVRVQGGAYGAFCSFDQFSGVFTYASYRDPNLLPTLESYDRTGQFLRELELSADELTKAIIGTIGDLDAYQLPDAKGYTAMMRLLTGVTDEYRQEMRDQVLGTGAADFRAFAGVLDQVGERGRVAVLGCREALEAVARERPGWLELVEVM